MEADSEGLSLWVEGGIGLPGEDINVDCSWLVPACCPGSVFTTGRDEACRYLSTLVAATPCASFPCRELLRVPATFNAPICQCLELRGELPCPVMSIPVVASSFECRRLVVVRLIVVGGPSRSHQYFH
jgi:hypothetical protein